MLCRTCFRILFLVAASLSPYYFAEGQITGNPYVTDPRAILITSKDTSMLCGRTWRYINYLEVRRDQQKEDLREGKIIKFSPNGTLVTNWNHGRWAIVGERILQIDFPELRHKQREFIQGSYSVYELNDTSLVLGQILTSNGDWRKELHFSTLGQAPPPRAPQWGVYQPYDSLRSGKRVRHYLNGNVSSIEYWQVVKRRASAEELFLYDDRTNILDSTRQHSIPVNRWVYYYLDGRISRTVNYGYEGQYPCMNEYNYQKNSPWPIIMTCYDLFVIGKMDSISLDRVSIDRAVRAEEPITETFQIRNLSPKQVNIRIVPNASLSVLGVSYKILQLDSVNAEIKLTSPGGTVNEILLIASDEWTLEAQIHLRGYHLTASDFPSSEIKSLPRRFFFYRTGGEYEMEILSLSRRSAKATIPISRQLTEIQLKKGKYRLTLRGTSGQATREVEVK